MSSQEIITLQFGNYSNYVGTHYWNFQQKRIWEKSTTEDELHYENLKLFRESNGASSRDRFLPRTICFDIKTKLQSLRQDGSFNDETAVESMDIDANGDMLNADCNLYEQPAIEKSDFLKHVLEKRDLDDTRCSYGLDDNVKSWSDFMTHTLHENSMQMLHDTYKDGDDFSYFGVGCEEYKALRDDFDDKMHFWVEECDHMEGFQVFSNIHDGYCGLMSKVLEDLSDEFDRKAKLCFLNWAFVDDVTNEKEKVYKYLNVALTLQSMKEYSSLCVLQSTENELLSKNRNPVQIPGVNFKHDNWYHTSALLASVIDSTTLPLYQLKSLTSLADLCYQVNQARWFLAGSAFGLPVVNSEPEITLFDHLLQSNGFYGQCMTSLFPFTFKDKILPSSHSVVLQNTPEHLVCPVNIGSSVLQNLGLNRNVFHQKYPLSVLEYFNERYYPCEHTAATVTYCEERLRTSLPFPDIIEDLSLDTHMKKKDVDIPIMSALYTSPQLYELFADVLCHVRKINLHKYHVVEQFGVDKDLLDELVEDLIHISQAYNRERCFHEFEE